MAESAQQQIAVLYAEHHSWLHARLRKKLGDSFTAADLAHDTFLRVLLACRSQDFSPETLREPRGYLTRIAHGLMVNHLRRRDFERAYLDALALQPEPVYQSPEERALVIEALMEIDSLLDSLPAKARRAFLLSQLEGLSYADIAEQLGVSVSMVKKYMFQAIRLCMQVQQP